MLRSNNFFPFTKDPTATPTTPGLTPAKPAGEDAESGDKVFVWDYTYDRPQPSSRMPKVRFGGNSFTISNRYLPECRSKCVQ